MHRCSWWAQNEQLVSCVVYLSALGLCSRRHSIENWAEQTPVIRAFEGYSNTEEEMKYCSPWLDTNLFCVSFNWCN